MTNQEITKAINKLAEAVGKLALRLPSDQGQVKSMADVHTLVAAVKVLASN